MEMLQGIWKQHPRPRAVVGYGVKIFLRSPPNYVTRSPGYDFNDNKLGEQVFDTVNMSLDLLEKSVVKAKETQEGSLKKKGFTWNTVKRIFN